MFSRIITSVVLTVALHSPSFSQPGTTETVSIALIVPDEPSEDETSRLMELSLGAFMAATDEGAVWGLQIDVQSYVDGCSVERAVEIARRVTAEPETLLFAIGHCTDVLEAVAPIYNETSVVLISPFAPATETYWPYGTVFQLEPSPGQFATALMGALLEQGFRRVHVRRGEGKYVAALAEAIQRISRDRDVEVTSTRLAADWSYRDTEEYVGGWGSDVAVVLSDHPSELLEHWENVFPQDRPTWVVRRAGSTDQQWPELVHRATWYNADITVFSTPIPEGPNTRLSRKYLRGLRHTDVRLDVPSLYVLAGIELGLTASIGRDCFEEGANNNSLCGTRWSENLVRTLEHRRYALRQNPVPTILGNLRSGEIGRVKPLVGRAYTASEYRASVEPLYVPGEKMARIAPSIPPVPGETASGLDRSPPHRSPPPPLLPPPSDPEPVENGDGDQSQRDSGESWNSWIQVKRIDGWQRVDHLTVDPDEIYQLNIDLSPFSYVKLFESEAPVASAEAGDEIERTISRLKYRQASELRLVVRVLITNPYINLAPGQQTQELLTVDISSFPDPDDDSYDRADHYSAAFADWDDTHKKFLEIVKEVQGGQFEIDLIARKSGCASIAMSIWNSAGTLPLDHLVRRIAVADGEDVPDCKDGSPLSSGLGALTYLGAEEQQKGPIKVDAALHIFEWDDFGNDAAVAVFVDRSLYEASRDAGDQADSGVYSWPLKSSISHYVSGGGLLSQIKEARRRAVNSLAPDKSYALAASDLKKKIFSSASTEARQDAVKAFEALQRIARTAKPEAVVLARIISADNEVVFLPFEIIEDALGLPTETALRVVHPLPSHRFLREQQCVDAWTFAIPGSLDGIGDESTLAEALLNPQPQQKPSWLTGWVRNLTQLTDYFHGDDSVATAAVTEAPRSEGLLLLSHHHDGDLWFKPPEAVHVTLEDMERKYPVGSVAILSACSTNVTGGNVPLIRQLNGAGIDAFVMSPFPVRADYGARLALDFVGTISDARSAGESLTIATLFDRAAQSTGVYFKNAGMPELEDMRKEFLLIGDYGLRLCEQ